MKLYKVDTWRTWTEKSLLAIDEVEVKKETEKTYVLHNNSVLKKSDMARWDGLYAISYDEAVKKAIEFANMEIIRCKEEIESLNDKITRYEKRLLELKNIDATTKIL